MTPKPRKPELSRDWQQRVLKAAIVNTAMEWYRFGMPKPLTSMLMSYCDRVEAELPYIQKVVTLLPSHAANYASRNSKEA